MGDLLCRKEVWGTSIGMFALGYVWVFLITWLPEYLVKQRGYTLQEMGVFGSLPYWGMAIASLSGGWLADVWIASGASATLARKTIALTGLIICAVLLIPAGVASDSKFAMALLIGACTALGLFTSNVWAITQTMAGPMAAGNWTGIQNFVGNLGGVVSPIAAGIIVQETGSFFAVFALAAGVVIAGAVVYGVTVGDVREIQFNSGWARINADHGGNSDAADVEPPGATPGSTATPKGFGAAPR
jgi:MFS family permease